MGNWEQWTCKRLSIFDESCFHFFFFFFKFWHTMLNFMLKFLFSDSLISQTVVSHLVSLFLPCGCKCLTYWLDAQLWLAKWNHMRWFTVHANGQWTSWGRCCHKSYKGCAGYKETLCLNFIIHNNLSATGPDGMTSSGSGPLGKDGKWTKGGYLHKYDNKQNGILPLNVSRITLVISG